MKKHFFLALGGIIFSTALLFASLWQIEIATALPGNGFDFPFYIWRVDKWWARDFWYFVNVSSWILAVISTAFIFYNPD